MSSDLWKQYWNCWLSWFEGTNLIWFEFLKGFFLFYLNNRWRIEIYDSYTIVLLFIDFVLIWYNIGSNLFWILVHDVKNQIYDSFISQSVYVYNGDLIRSAWEPNKAVRSLYFAFFMNSFKILVMWRRPDEPIYYHDFVINFWLFALTSFLFCFDFIYMQKKSLNFVAQCCESFHAIWVLKVEAKHLVRITCDSLLEKWKIQS